QGESVQLGHQNVADHQVGPTRLYQGQSLCAVIRFNDLCAHHLEQTTQEPRDPWIIVHHDYGAAGQGNTVVFTSRAGTTFANAALGVSQKSHRNGSLRAGRFESYSPGAVQGGQLAKARHRTPNGCHYVGTVAERNGGRSCPRVRSLHQTLVQLLADTCRQALDGEVAEWWPCFVRHRQVFG